MTSPIMTTKDINGKTIDPATDLTTMSRRFANSANEALSPAATGVGRWVCSTESDLWALLPPESEPVSHVIKGPKVPAGVAPGLKCRFGGRGKGATLTKTSPQGPIGLRVLVGWVMRKVEIIEVPKQAY